MENPLWDQLAAVQAGQVYEMDDEVWGTGLGPLAAMEVVEDLEEVFVEGEIEDVYQPTASTAPGFPVTIEHTFGTIEIPAEPQRIITIGFSEQDSVLALGVIPVAVREWFGKQPNAVWPWAQDELGDAEPEVLTMPFGELDFETIAALEPDLIIATHSGITAEEYETLSQIAPTVAQSGDYPDFGMSWQEQTRVIGRALGRLERAEELIAEVEAHIADAAEAHPEFDGATIAWASPSGDGQYWAVGTSTPPMQFLAALGFRLPDELAGVIGDLDSAEISSEQLGLLDTDVLIVQVSSEDERSAIEEDPLYQQLDVASEGRTIFFVGQDNPIYRALSFSTVLSLPFAVDNLVPILAIAVDGDPDTEVTS
jgi:iron complex transport system substrate-binding protein